MAWTASDRRSTSSLDRNEDVLLSVPEYACVVAQASPAVDAALEDGPASVQRTRVEDQGESARPTPEPSACRSPWGSRSQGDEQTSCFVSARDTACRGALSRAWPSVRRIPSRS